MLMPPNSTRSRLTLASSVVVGVYSGRSVTSWPRAISSTASALSREQLPQYMPAAPAVMDRIFIELAQRRARLSAERCGSPERLALHIAPATLQLRGLERPGTEQELDEVAFVRLQPVQLRGRHRPEVEPIDVHGVDETAAKRGVAGDGAAHQRRADRVQHLRLRALDDRDERE